MGGVFNHINGNLYHYAGNNPVRYIDPDGRESEEQFFDYTRYMYRRLEGELSGVVASFQNLFGELKNFASNLVAGNGNVESYYSVSVGINNISYNATMYVSKSSVSFEFSEPTDVLINALQNVINMPITLDSKGINGEIPLGTYYNAALSVPISFSKKAPNVATLTLGLKGSMKSPTVNKAKISGETGIKITASVQDGPFGTIRNRKNPSLNRNLDAYRYYTSNEFFMENFK